MTPTGDQLIQFAAEKCGVEIAYYNDTAFRGEVEWGKGDIVATPKRGGWFILGSSRHIVERWDPLTSWEWLGKGMAAFSDGATGCTIYPHWVSIWDKDGERIENEYGKVADIPRAFWTAWWRLEKEVRA